MFFLGLFLVSYHVDDMIMSFHLFLIIFGLTLGCFCYLKRVNGIVTRFYCYLCVELCVKTSCYIMKTGLSPNIRIKNKTVRDVHCTVNLN